ncbi:MAG: hypothetical protein GX434_17710 [Peptococcaceae bacterium]|nr:hypothetical protein [Peptococcaceae bacterium]
MLTKYLKSIGKIQDSAVISILGGLIGMIPMDISNYLLWKKGKTENLYGHVAGSMLMSKFRMNQTKNFILGQFWHYAAGAGFGFPAFYLLKKTGKDHLLLKGASVGMFTWGLLYNFGMRIGLYGANPRLTKTKYAALWHNFLYGVTTVYAISAIADPGLFPQKQNNRDISAQNMPISEDYKKGAHQYESIVN